ncbi:hypothetical protein [Sulfurimonas sp.]|uniref:hypothetical protein n=1 Tax=Sulfurimonas sp. TaxID=2022749 RepID=UPI0019FF3D04|nr:hypothetical protein [Sulfurimonas sp.]MBE0514224.1 hypothetical protein [Sulfurimonas sp.]
MKYDTERKRFTFKTEIAEILEREAKKVLKTESEFIEDLIYKNSVERDNRLSNKIARDTENLMLLNILNKEDLSELSIEEIYKKCNVINNDKKIYLAEKRSKEVGFYKEVKKIVNAENFEELIDNLKKSDKDYLKQLRLFGAVFKELNLLVKKYE